ncbi:MAG: Dabb family protein [Polyangiaceae bacterium]|nr:Dabb family protein [Polyangiaceae bacterium]
MLRSAQRISILFPMVTHIVFFDFETTDIAQEAQQKLLSMEGKIPGLISIEVGLDFTRSERSFDLALITRHDTRQALETYRTHPVHLEVAEFIQNRSKGAAAVDFES